jgi:protein O-mannosyl-transferase
MKKPLLFISLFIMLLLIVSAYLNTYRSPAILDDYHTLAEVRQNIVISKGLSIENALSLSRTVFGWYRWVPLLTMGFDQWAGNGGAFQFHLTNLIVHILCALAVFLLAFQLIDLQKGGGSAPAIYCALWVAAIWALHPIQTSAITYVVQRMASIQSFFYISSVCFYIAARKRNIQTPRFMASLPYYLGCLVSAVGAFLSKENAFMLPPMLFLTEIWFFRPELPSSMWRRIRSSGFLVQSAVAIAFVLFVILSVAVCRHLADGYSHRHFNMEQRLLTQTRIIIYYLTLLLMPLPSRLSMEHDVEISTSLWDPITTLYSSIALLLMAILIVKYRKQAPLLTYAGAWFFANLFIESSFIGLELIFEHRLYLPSFGFVLFFVLGAVGATERLLQHFSQEDLLKLRWSAFAILFSLLALLTFQRNEAWTDFVAIHQDATEKAPENSRAHANLAVAYLRDGKHEDAIKEAELAISLGRDRDENYMVAANAIVGSLLGQGLNEQAIKRGEELLANKPKECDLGAIPETYLNLAQAHLAMEQHKEAYLATSHALEHACNLGRNYVEFNLIGSMLSKILQTADAKRIDLDEDGAFDPGELPMKAWIAREFLRKGERRQARTLLEEAAAEKGWTDATRQMQSLIDNEDGLDKIQREKENFREKYVYKPHSVFNICMAGAYLIRLAKLPEPFLAFGQELLRYAMSINPNNPDPYLLMGWCYHEKGDTEKAIESVRVAIDLDPDNAKSWIGLGFFLISANEPLAAINSFQKVLELYPGYQKKRVISVIISDLEKGIRSVNASKASLDRS